MQECFRSGQHTAPLAAINSLRFYRAIGRPQVNSGKLSALQLWRTLAPRMFLRNDAESV